MEWFGGVRVLYPPTLPGRVASMAQISKRFLVGGGVLLLVACIDSVGPTAVKLAFTVEPRNAQAGVVLGPVAVAIQDASEFTVTRATSVVTVSIGTGPTGSTVAGTVSTTAVDGVAIFPSLHIDKVGIGYTLKATATGLIGATSTPFTILAAPATRLEFVVQPRNTMESGAITPAVQVAARDPFGNLTTAFGDSVTVALGGNPAPGTLSGTTVVRAVNGVATFNDLSIAQVSAGYTLTAGARGLTGVTSVPFNITKPAGVLRITTVTSGNALDPDGYAICVDSASDGHGGTSCAYAGPLAIGVNGTETVTVDTGAHTVLLIGIAANCAVGLENPRAVHVSRGETVAVPFGIACGSLALHITTTTTGDSLGSDGYSLCVDPTYYSDSGCTYSSAIGLNGAVTVPVSPGTHAVYLGGVAGNCDVGGTNPRSVDARTTREVPFAVTCFAMGSVTVTTVTTGPDNPDGYTICVNRGSNGCYWHLRAGANDVVTIAGVTAILHTVEVVGLSGNCMVSGSTARDVTVPPGGTVVVTFNVACTHAERIAYSSPGTIMVMHTDGTAIRTIAPGFAPAWSPDGARLAYECPQDLCAINADGTGFAQLTADGASNHHPTWSPDGMRIAFAATHGGATELYVMAANGSGVARLTNGIGVLGSPAWSPDGATIAFDCRVAAGNDDICVVNADGSAVVRLTNHPARDYGAAWKPDGSTLAFATRRYGTDEVVLMSPDGGSVTRIGGGLPGFEPTWSPDGSQIAFVQAYTCGYYDYCNGSYEGVSVAHSDGSNLHYLTNGNQPAWRPHP